MVPLLLSNLCDVASALQGAAGELRSGKKATLQSLTGETAASTAAPVHTSQMKLSRAFDGSS